ncbi:hypothetical protein FBZ89_105197 [Nitrospirillum amazonense]|uniref:Uncharacterized protein n=1 Tax=Nitrospirillum amazonense TaxID=28077 RepID=A0A560FI98_9PROT|nr:hypothetical protein [Nitrospirillum amazonense]TWB21324.1 hypothetical protein FBZ89_105197 [Nitrospirillum amazonense]
MTDLTMTAATRTFTAHAGHTPRALSSLVRHLPLLAVTALLSVAIVSLF